MSGVRLSTLFVLACVLCVCALPGRETRGNSQPAMESANAHLVASVTPSPDPKPIVGEKRPNVVRRFFGWTIDRITRPFRKEPQFACHLPPSIDLRASKSQITFCPATGSSGTSASCSPERDVTLVASAPEPEAGDHVRFTWAVTAGAIRGEGHKVSWDLNGVPEGTYTATVERTDAHHHTVSTSTTVTVALCSGCEKPPPLCPTVTVSCPSDVGSGTVPFVATVEGGDPDMQPTFTWTTTAGKIVSGQGTSKLIVDASDLGGRSLTATVSLGGAHPACTVLQASCTLVH